jgi:hypothetical protein
LPATASTPTDPASAAHPQGPGSDRKDDSGTFLGQHPSAGSQQSDATRTAEPRHTSVPAQQTADRIDPAGRGTDERPPAFDDPSLGPAVARLSQRLDALASAGRQPDGPVAELPGVRTAGGSSTELAAADVERLLDRAIGQIRTVGRPGDPALEARLQDPELGTVRVLVSGRTGDVVRAELVVADQRIADALTRAVDRSATSHGLTGIDLRIRTESGRPGGDPTGSGGRSDGRGPDLDQRGWAGTNGGFDRGLDQGRGESWGSQPRPRDQGSGAQVPAIAAIRRPLPTAGSVDIRA